MQTQHWATFPPLKILWVSSYNFGKILGSHQRVTKEKSFTTNFGEGPTRPMIVRMYVLYFFSSFFTEKPVKNLFFYFKPVKTLTHQKRKPLAKN